MKVLLHLNINGQIHDVYVPVQKTLLEVLREDLGLPGTKHGCELGECGACTVLVDGNPVLSCLTLPVEVQHSKIETVEGLGNTTNPHPLQQEFAARGAAQCGYCTPGMLMSAKALLDKKPLVNQDEIKTALSGNLCRCTGYQRILDAVEAAGQRMAAEAEPVKGD